MTIPQGVLIKVSHFTVDETVSRLTGLLRSKSATIYAAINQQEELGKIGIIIPPMQFILFGNPKSGGKVMIDNPIAGLDLPLKVLVWEDESNTVRIAYNDPNYLRNRYRLSSQLSVILDIDPLLKSALEMN